MPAQLIYNATLAERINLMPSLAIFRVIPDDWAETPRAQNFKPGQYVTLGLNSADSSVRRPMSIASAPLDSRGYEFYIRYVEQPESNLPLTHLLWQLPVGERMYLRAIPTGHFTVEDTNSADSLKICIAAGTGLAPFISIARHRLAQDPKASLEDIVIIHGASQPEALGYFDELNQYKAQHGLRYLPTISRPTLYPSWAGATGRAEQTLAPERLESTEQRLGLSAGSINPQQAKVLICGLQGTIANTLTYLLHRGFAPAHRKIRKALEIGDDIATTLFYEQYDTTPVLDVTDESAMAELRRVFHQSYEKYFTSPA